MKPVSWQSVEDCCELYAYNESPVFSSILNKKNNFNQNLNKENDDYLNMIYEDNTNE